MMHEEVQAALNEQINYELESAYVYLAMSSYCENQNMPGFANWMRQQATEENGHALRLFDYMHDRGGTVKLGAIEEPKSDWGSIRGAVAAALAHEQSVTERIHKLYGLAGKNNDYATQTQLHWFIDEQVEEEKSVSDLLAALELSEGAPAAMLVLDREVAKRGPEPAAAGGEPA